MASFDDMIDDLTGLKLYDLSEGSTAVAELYSYSFYLDHIAENIGLLFSSCFLSEINSRNKYKYCNLFSLPVDSSLAVVHDMVIKRMALTNQDFTKAGVKKSIDALGFDVVLTESLGTNFVRIIVKSDMGLFKTKEEKEAQIKSCLPCHLACAFTWEV